MKFPSKADFELATQEQWNQLWSIVKNRSGKPAVQTQLKQILAHLYSWHELLLDWYRVGQNRTPELPAPGFNWRQTQELNGNWTKNTWIYRWPAFVEDSNCRTVE